MCPKMGIGASVSTAVSEKTAVIIEDYMFDASTAGELQPEVSPSDFHDTWDLDGTDFTPEASPDDEGYWDDFENIVLNHNYEELGSELVTNGTFDADSDWNTSGGSDASISGGKANFVNAAKGQRVQQNFSFTADKTYKIVIVISNYSGSGNLGFYMGGDYAISNISANGTYTLFHTPTNTTEAFFRAMTTSALHTFSVDSITVKQVDPNDRWTLDSTYSIEDGKLKAVNGATYGAYQANILTSGTTYEINYTVSDYSSGTFGIRANTTAGITVTANGTYTDIITSNGAHLYFLGFGTFNGSVDNVTVKEYAITPLDV